jgi:hypothetical protein
MRSNFRSRRIDRPAAITRDTAISESAMLHGLKQEVCGLALPEHLVYCKCTSPFIAPGHVKQDPRGLGRVVIDTGAIYHPQPETDSGT